MLLALAVAGAGCGARVGRAPAWPKSHADAPSEVARTIEETSPALRSALAELARGETPAALRNVAEEYHRLGIFDRAEAFLDRAIRLRPSDSASFDLRARVYRDWGEPDGALGDATRAVYFAPASAGPRNTLGTVLFVLGRHDEAEAAFEKALALDPSAAWASSNLCYLALTQGDEARAVGHCERALAADETLVPARHNLALTHAAAGRFDDARREFEAAGSPAQAHYNVGIIHLARRDYDRAVESFDAALRVSPKFDAAFVRAQEARRLAARR
jgi:tetratricopeptide (TPR) repeat protein